MAVTAKQILAPLSAVLGIVVVGAGWPLAAVEGRKEKRPRPSPCNVDERALRRETVFRQKVERYFRSRAASLDGDIAPDRLLSLEDLSFVLKLSNALVDKRLDTSTRDVCAKYLGEFGHEYGLPALMAVIRDDTEEKLVRQTCIHAICRIRDVRVVEFMINEVLADYKNDEHLHSTYWAAEYLCRLVHDPLFQWNELQPKDHKWPKGEDFAGRPRSEWEAAYKAEMRRVCKYRYELLHKWWVEHCAKGEKPMIILTRNRVALMEAEEQRKPASNGEATQR